MKYRFKESDLQSRRRRKFEALAQRKQFIREIVATLPDDALAVLADSIGEPMNNLRLFAQGHGIKLLYLRPIEAWLTATGTLRIAEGGVS